MSQVLDLLTLQSSDDESASLHAALADVERRLQADEELAEARLKLVAAESAAADARRDQRRVEAEVEDLSDRIARDEGRLYDGSIHNPKELGSLQHEVEGLKQNRSGIEDELIGLLDAAEEAERQRLAAGALVHELGERWRVQQDSLRHEVLRLTDAIARAEARRDMQKAKVSPRSLAVYEDLRRRKGGLAIVRLSGGSCGGCRVSVPDAVRRQALDANILARCPNCERILSLG